MKDLYTLRDDFFIIRSFHTLIAYISSNLDGFDSGMQLLGTKSLLIFIYIPTSFKKYYEISISYITLMKEWLFFLYSSCLRDYCGGMKLKWWWRYSGAANGLYLFWDVLLIIGSFLTLICYISIDHEAFDSGMHLCCTIAF